MFYMGYDMKKAFALTFSLFCVMLVASGCNYAEHSGNIKYVSATFSVLGSEFENRLTKEELPYSRMNIQPKESSHIKGVAFTAKLKGDTSRDDVSFLVNVYVSGGETNLEAKEEVCLKRQFNVELAKKEKEIVIFFDTPFRARENLLDDKMTEEISVEFLNLDGSKNKEVSFSMNNIKLLTQ
jgi:hypothetical protein